MMEEDNRLNYKHIVWTTLDNYSWWLARAVAPLTPITENLAQENCNNNKVNFFS
jgi:hypothetical protein